MDSGVKYARSDGIHIAYRVFGDGPRDMVPRINCSTR